MSKDCNQDKSNIVSQFNQSATKLANYLPKYCSCYFILFFFRYLVCEPKSANSYVLDSILAVVKRFEDKNISNILVDFFRIGIFVIYQ
jgi:hypothetical protein